MMSFMYIKLFKKDSQLLTIPECVHWNYINKSYFQLCVHLPNLMVKNWTWSGGRELDNSPIHMWDRGSVSTLCLCTSLTDTECSVMAVEGRHRSRNHWKCFYSPELCLTRIGLQLEWLVIGSAASARLHKIMHVFIFLEENI